MLEEDANRHFDLPFASPHMLYFARVRSRELKALTHVDESARPQTVSRVKNPGMYALLEVFMRLTGFGVLCNTSLDLKGRGFIDRTTDLARDARDFGLDGLLVNQRVYVAQDKISTYPSAP